MNHNRSYRLLTTLLLLLAPLLVSTNWGSQHWPIQANPIPNLDEISTQNAGTEFWLAFPHGNPDREAIRLFITGAANTTGQVDIPGLGFSQSFVVTAGAVTTIGLPLETDLGPSSDVVGNKGVHVTAQADVTVYGMNRKDFSTDAYLGLPVDTNGTEYIVLAYENSEPGILEPQATQFAIVAAEDATSVTITPSETTGTRTAGVPYTITMNEGQTYQLFNSDDAGTDLTGTIITSDKPISVFGSHTCANIPPDINFCDHLVEQLPPPVSWGKEFVTMPLATRVGGDTFRFLASTDGTVVRVNGVIVALINRGNFHEQLITTPAHIVANAPILVAQYSNGTDVDFVTSDPFMMLITPFEQFLGDYTVTTPTADIMVNYINVVAPDEAAGAITLDGTAIPAGSFTPIGASGFSGVQLNVALGSHNLAGPLPFGVFVYGFDSADSYGYPGGGSLAPVADVTTLTLTPETSTDPLGLEHCVVATVTDADGGPVPAVRVDFEVSGANSAAGFANADTNGQAEFCYTGTAIGPDTIKASVGTVADTAAEIWVELADLAGHKFDDVEGNGMGGADLPLGGIDIVLLDDVTDAELRRTTTGLDGSYAFVDVEPGDYAVCEDLSALPGRRQTFPPGGPIVHPIYGICYNLTVAFNQDISNLDFYNHTTASLTIIKEATPETAQIFNFTSPNPGIGDFNLDGGLDPGTPDSLTFSGLLSGTVTISEIVPPDWFLTQISCDNGLLVSNPAPSTLSLDLSSGDDIVCTFRNGQGTGKIVVAKQSNPAGAPAIFSFSGAATGVIGAGQQIIVDNVSPGTYAVTEALLAGWNLTGITCDDANSSGDIATRTATFRVEPAETVTCTFSNDQQGSTIIVKKQTQPTGAPDTFTFSGAAAGAIGDGEQIVVGNLSPGAYLSTETVPPDWALTDITCDDANSSGDIGAQTATFRVEAAEIITCIFTNQRQLGAIIVAKQTEPAGEPDTFAFSGDVNGVIGHGQQLVVDNLPPGVYTSTEAALPAWELTAITCDDANSSGDLSSRTATFQLEAGEIITCAFTNEQGTVITLLSFTAQAAVDHVTLAWQTGTETDNAGFNLYRATADAAGPYKKLNPALIPAQGDPVSGASYTYTDDSVTKGVTYFYYLEDLDLSGLATQSEPIAATPGAGQTFYLPVIFK